MEYRLNRVALVMLAGLVMAPAAPAAPSAETMHKAIPTQKQIDNALALVTCKADRTAFRTLAYQLRDIASRPAPSPGWQPVASSGGDYSSELGNMPGVIAEMRLPSPVLVFGHPSTRLILSRSSVLAAFDDPAIAADLATALAVDKRDDAGAPGGMRVVHSAPEAQGDGVEVMALVVEQIEAEPAPIAVAGCLYFTR